jgi:hypothetical protein
MTQTDNATCQKLLVTSTRHLSERTVSLLRATDPYHWPYGGGPYNKSGFFYRTMKRNGCSDGFLPIDLFEILAWAGDNEYHSVLFADNGPTIERFEVYRELESYADGLMWEKPCQQLDYERSQRDSALNALSVGGRAFEVSPENMASALDIALDAVDQYLTLNEEEGLWDFPLVSLQRIADVATIYKGERSYKTGEWDKSITAAAELRRLLSFEIERSKYRTLDLQQRLAHSLAEQIRYLLQEPL